VPPRTFSAADVLTSSLAIFARHFPVLLVLSAAFRAVPFGLGLLQFAVGSSLRSENEPRWLTSVGGVLGVTWVITHWLLALAFQAVVTLAVFRVLSGRSPGWSESVRQGLSRLPLALATGLCVVLGLALPFVIILAFAPTFGVLAVIAAISLGCLWFVAVQAAVVEGVRPLRALGRSVKLTDGALRRIFGIAFLVYAVPEVAMILLRGGDRAMYSVSELCIESAFGALFGALQAVVSVVLYCALRKAKEGVGLDELLAVFD
jgi:hypothetical protein